MDKKTSETLCVVYDVKVEEKKVLGFFFSGSLFV